MKLLLSLMMALGFCSVSFAQNSALQPQGPAVYENKDAGFTIIGPAGWTKKEWVKAPKPPDMLQQSSGVIFSLHPVDQTQQKNVQMQLSCYAAPVSFNLEHPLDSANFGGMKGLVLFCNGIVAGLVKAADRDYSLIRKPAALTVNGTDGVWFSYDVVFKKAAAQNTLRFAEYHFLNKDRWVFIMCVGGKDDFAGHEKEIRGTINSLKFH